MTQGAPNAVRNDAGPRCSKSVLVRSPFMDVVDARSSNSLRGEPMRLTPSKRTGSGLVPILAAATLLAMPAALRAQGTVTGLVTTATNEPLSDARVMVVNTSLIVPTGADGHYTIRNAPTGNIEVRVLRVGYQEQKKAVTVSAGATVTARLRDEAGGRQAAGDRHHGHG